MIKYNKGIGVMNTIKIDKGTTKLIAHRGLPFIERENTIKSFKEACIREYYGIECDIHATKDNEIIICHDDNIARVTGVNKRIKNLLFQDLIKIKIKDLNNNPSLSFPTLGEFIDICKEFNKISFIEIKNRMKIKNIIRILKLLDNNTLSNDCVIISFSKSNIKKIRKINKDIKLELITKKYNNRIFRFLKKYNCDIDIFYKSINNEIIDYLHMNNIKINTWTVDDEKDALRLIDMNVDYITTNRLE